MQRTLAIYVRILSEFYLAIALIFTSNLFLVENMCRYFYLWYETMRSTINAFLPACLLACLFVVTQIVTVSY